MECGSHAAAAQAWLAHSTSATVHYRFWSSDFISLWPARYEPYHLGQAERYPERLASAMDPGVLPRMHLHQGYPNQAQSSGYTQPVAGHAETNPTPSSALQDQTPNLHGIQPHTYRAMVPNNSPMQPGVQQDGHVWLTSIQPTSCVPSHCQIGCRMRERGRFLVSTVVTLHHTIR